MADKELRLKISTALDAAGIKATKQQIDGLEQQLGKIKDSGGSAESALNKLGKLKGQLGPLQDMLGGIGGAIGKIGGVATMAAAAFKAGWDVGTWINDKVIAPMLKIKDANEELIKSNKKRAEEHKKALDAMAKAEEDAEKSQAEAIARIDEQTKHYDALRQATEKAARAKSELANADKDIEIQRLARQRWEDLTTLRDEGDEEGARQAELVYDIMMKQLEAKKALAKFDAEHMADQSKIEAADEKLNALYEKRAAIDSRLYDLERNKKKIDDTATSQKDWQTRWDKNEQKIKQNEKMLRDVESQIQAAEIERDSLDTLSPLAKKQRALLADQAQMGIDEAAMSWQRDYMKNGDLIGWTPDENMVKELTFMSEQT